MLLFRKKQNNSNGPTNQLKENQIKQLAIQNRELNVLSELSKSIISTHEADTILQKTVDLIPQDLGYIGVIVALLNKDRTELRVSSITNNPIISKVLPMLGKDKSEFVVMMDDQSFDNMPGVQAIKQDKIIATNDFIDSFIPAIPRLIIEGIYKVLRPKSLVSVPIKSKDVTLGVIGFILKDLSADEIDENTYRFMQSYTHIVGIALNNSQLFAEKELLLKKVQKTVDELEEAARKEKDMLDILAHELRTPLSTARNAFSVLENDLQRGDIKDKKLYEHMNILKDNLQREIRLLETMLSSTKIENNKLQLKLDIVNLNKICETIYLAYIGEVSKKELEFTKDIPNNEIFVSGDEDRIIEIIGNLLNNAVKYTTKGYISLQVLQDEKYNGICIKDSGEGIPAQDIPNLGKKFYRVNQHIDQNENSFHAFTRPGGSGLGLYVAFGLAKLMNGKIQVESEVGKGSRFTLWLPREKDTP